MGNLSITGQSTQAPKKAAPKKVTPKKVDVNINFNSLPKSLNNASVRKFYDKDNSGYIESSNKNGVNEYALIADYAKSKKVDLMKHTIKTENCSFDNKNQEFTFFCNKYSVFASKYSFSGNSKDRVENDTLYNDKKQPVFIQHLEWSKPNKNGESYIKSGNYKLNEYKNVTKGKNNVQKVSSYTNAGKKAMVLGMEIKNAVTEGTIPDRKNYKKTRTTYTLNGKPVQAKPIGKGRYEVIDKNGNVSYISHDGVKLKPEYVRKNP